jgi:periplasmic protein CpxP/Spy
MKIIALECIIVLGTSGAVLAQQDAGQTQGVNHSAPAVHGPRSIDQELDHLTKDLELSAQQRVQVRPLLELHYYRIQALLDKNPNRSRQELGEQIHAISEQTHHEIEALLNDHQKQLAKAMQDRMHAGASSKEPKL